MNAMGMFAARCLLVMTVLLAMAGCGSIAVENMVATSVGQEAQFSGSVSVRVEDSGANRFFRSRIGVEELQDALSRSVARSGLFSDGVQPSSQGKYELIMTITNVGNFWGLTAKIGITSTWELRERSVNQAVWKDVVYSEGVATAGDKFSGEARIRLAIERGMQEHFQMGIEQLTGISE